MDRASGATANGLHAAIIEVDPITFDLKILKYVVVHDCGTVINPMILEGQIHGGVAQGIGNAFYEKLAFNDQGQLLNYWERGKPAPKKGPIELQYHGDQLQFRNIYIKELPEEK